MTTATLTLTDFLLARIGEDEAVTRDCLFTSQPRTSIDSDPDRDYSLIIDPGRVLAEIAAKRALIEDHDEYHECTGPGYVNGPGSADDDEFEPCNVLRHLASIYSDHPDYREEWKA